MAEYIDRREVVEAICFNCSEINICVGVCDDTDRIINIPAADVRPVVRGRWELAEDGWYCTACKLYPPFDCDPEEKGVPFCPWCGADMRGDVE